MRSIVETLKVGTAVASLALAGGAAWGSSHMDAPMITLDDPANTTDVYAFISTDEESDTQYLTTALAVNPFEEPGIGPNAYRFDDDVLYEIHIALGRDVDEGRKTISYQFRFETEFSNQDTILQSYLGVISGKDTDIDDDGFDENQNLRQTYTVTKVDRRYGHEVVLGWGRVPPNNQGLVTPEYNQAGDGEMLAKEGVASEGDLDAYTRRAITELDYGHRAFAGQRDDGFYADIQSIFDLDFSFGAPSNGDPGSASKPFDSQGGFNVHTIVLNIPFHEFYGAKRAGVFATTSRQRRTKLSKNFEKNDDRIKGRFIQIARQGNPLFAEALVALRDKDLYSRTTPRRDEDLFEQYALEPELATILGVADENRTDIAGIYIPDVIKVDLTTGPARLAGELGFHRLGIFGGDLLQNAYGQVVPGGWPNGRRFGDDVVDVAVLAILGLDPATTAGANVDRVMENDITFNDVFPYAATPLNGRVHEHH